MSENTIIGRGWTAGKVIRELMRSNTAMQEFCGSRIYPLVAPEGSDLPLCVYRLNRTDRDGRHTTGNSGIVTRSYAVECHGQDYDELDAFAARFAERLESWRGVEGSLTVRRIVIDDESDEQYDRPSGGEDDAIFLRLFQITLHLIENTTSLPQGSYGG
jgi:hypothetical protein